MPCPPPGKKGKTYLPFFQVVLLGLVLFDQIVEDLLQPLGVGLEGGLHILDGPLYQDAVDHAEALAVARERLQSLEDEPGSATTTAKPPQWSAKPFPLPDACTTWMSGEVWRARGRGRGRSGEFRLERNLPEMTALGNGIPVTGTLMLAT